MSGVFKQLSQGLEPPAHSTIEGLTGNSESRASIDSAATFEVDTDHDAIHLIFSTPDAKVSPAALSCPRFSVIIGCYAQGVRDEETTYFVLCFIALN